MTRSTPVRLALFGLAVILAGGLAACIHTGTIRTGAIPASQSPAATASATAVASRSPAHYFADGKTYDAWIISNGPTSLTLALGHHLVDTPTDKAATAYLVAHGQPVPPEGVPNDYIDVDLGVHKTEPLSASAVITINPDGSGPQTLTVPAFLTWLTTNKAKPVPTGGGGYPGSPKYFGSLFALTFSADTVVSANQVFEP